MNIFDYVKKYGNKTFKELNFNEIDNVVLSSIMYLKYCKFKGKKSLLLIGVDFFENNNYEEISKIGIAQKNAYKLLKLMISSRRYSLILLSNYIYEVNKNTQFSALTFILENGVKYIAFEGTDDSLIGWKEDLLFGCKFPVTSQKLAIEYVNRSIKLNDRCVYIGGHSKGGNLALVSGMYSKSKKKICKIFSNDGPGLRKEEFDSLEYKEIKDKLIHIVPYNSLVGAMLYSDVFNPIKTTRKDIRAHSTDTWVINETHFLRNERTKTSLKIETYVKEIVDAIPYTDQIELINGLFDMLGKNHTITVHQLFDVKTLTNFLNEFKNINPEFKDKIVTMLKIIVKEFFDKEK